MRTQKIGQFSKAGRGTNTRFTWKAFALRYFEALGTPKALACSILLRNGEYGQLVDLTAEASDYLTAADFFVDHSAVKLLSKLPALGNDEDCRASAMKKFIEAEEICDATNQRFWSESRLYETEPAVRDVLNIAARKISRILGPVPQLADLNFRFGPGAAYGVRGETSVFQKLDSTPECTFAFKSVLTEFRQEFPIWTLENARRPLFRLGSELAFVPKNAKTHRAICIEPLLNGLYQKGVGSYMRYRLSRWGVNLDDQGVNQKLAARALERGLSTIDFSMASDTVSYALVLDLLPFDWFEFLDVARCPMYRIEGSWYPFQKFTSMGNAYTFELETLLFYTLACASCEVLGVEYETGVTLSVYGDDVIIPTAAQDLFSEVSSYCGFSINPEKSHSTGLFRESCGHDYFDGRYVRPFLLKKDISTVEDQYYVTNSTLQTAGTLQALPDSSRTRFVHERLLGVHRWCIGCIPRRHRLLVPQGSGDGGLVADFDVAHPPRWWRNPQWDGYAYRSVRRLAVRYEPPAVGFPMAYALYHAGGSTSSRLSSLPRPPIFKRMGGRLREGELPKCRDIPDFSYAGSGYVIRGRTRVRTLTQFWFGPWPQAPACWSSEAIALVDPIKGKGKANPRTRSKRRKK